MGAEQNYTKSDRVRRRHEYRGAALFPYFLRLLPRFAPAQDQLTVERIVDSREFAPDFLPPTRWLDDSTYTSVQRRPDGKGADLVAVNAPTDAPR
jgi:hypothetical protein